MHRPGWRYPARDPGQTEEAAAIFATRNSPRYSANRHQNHSYTWKKQKNSLIFLQQFHSISVRSPPPLNQAYEEKKKISLLHAAARLRERAISSGVTKKVFLEIAYSPTTHDELTDFFFPPAKEESRNRVKITSYWILRKIRVYRVTG